MANEIEYFAKFPENWATVLAGRSIRCFKADELSSWCVHGTDFDAPFADVPKRANRWAVSHINTLRRIPKAAVGDLTFSKAMSLAIRLDQVVEAGMSQVREQEAQLIMQSMQPLGWSKEAQTAIREAVLEWKDTTP